MAEAAATLESALSGLLRDHGVEAARADGLCCELVRDYPLVRRRGLPVAESRFREWGMESEQAQEAARVLLAFELLGRVPYEQALEILAGHCPEQGPLAVCLRAARLRRAMSDRPQIHEPRPIGSRIIRYAMTWLGSR